MSKYELDKSDYAAFGKTKYKDLFIEYMEANNIKYTDVDEFCVRVSYSGDNMRTIAVYLMFDKDGEGMVQFVCMEIAKFKNNTAPGILTCNDMNTKYRWVKFYVDGDGDLMCEADAYIDEYTCGEECMKMVRRVVNIVDDTYPTFMKALWAN